MTRARLAALLSFAVASVAAQPQFRTGVEGVLVDVLVTDNGRPVRGLTAPDFELRDSGVPQAIDAVAFEDVPVSVLLTLDTSASVRGTPLVHLKEAASALVKRLLPQDRAALVTFTGKVALRCDWTGDRNAVLDALDRVQADGATSLHDAVYAALTLRDPTPNRALVLVFSDGADTASWLPGTRAVELAKQQDAVVYAVTTPRSTPRTFGYLADTLSGLQPRFPNVAASAFGRSFLEDVTEESGGAVMPAERTAELDRTFQRVMQEFRSRYVLSYTPRGVDAAGWHPLEVRVKGRTAKVQARRGYQR